MTTKIQPTYVEIVDCAAELAKREGLDPSWIYYPTWGPPPPCSAKIWNRVAELKAQAVLLLRAEETPSEEAPAEEIPADETSADETPAEEPELPAACEEVAGPVEPEAERIEPDRIESGPPHAAEPVPPVQPGVASRLVRAAAPAERRTPMLPPARASPIRKQAISAWPQAA